MIDFAECKHPKSKKFGKTKAGEQRHRCTSCGKTFTESTRKLAGMRIGMEKAAQVIGMLVEGMSVSATARLTDTDPHTVIDLMMLVGERCKIWLERRLRNLAVEEIQCDEIWQFIYCKRKRAHELQLEQFVNYQNRVGDSYTFTAVDRHTKMVVAWHFGGRTLWDTDEFCRKLAEATTGRFHLSTDGYQPYRVAVPLNLPNRVDYGSLVKIFGRGTPEDRRTYSPAPIIGTRKEAVLGNPDEKRVCTSHTERNNGSIRNFVKRMGRLTYCFSKRWINHECALGLYFAHFNFCRKHKTLKGRTPAMEADLTDHVWTVAELLEAVSNT